MCKAHRLLYHSTLGLRGIKKKKNKEKKGAFLGSQDKLTLPKRCRMSARGPNGLGFRTVQSHAGHPTRGCVWGHNPV